MNLFTKKTTPLIFFDEVLNDSYYDKTNPLGYSITSKTEKLDVNRCFDGDVIIVFPLRKDQYDYISNTCEKLERFAKEKIELKETRVIHYNKIWAEALDKASYEESGLTHFQKEQIKINARGACRHFHPESPGIYTGYQEVYFPSLIVHNQFKEVVKTIYNHLHTYSIRELMAYDRNGPLFSLFRKYLKEVIDTNYSRINYNSMTHPIEKSVYLARYNNEDELEILEIFTDRSHQIKTNWYIYGTFDNIETSYIKSNEKETVALFEQLYKEYTNRDYKERDIFSPVDGYYGHLRAPFTRRYQIPPLKKLCFSVLSEIFLIDKNDFIEKIDRLTQDNIREFLVYSSENKKPVGGEIVEFLLERQLKSDSHEYVDVLFPFNILIPSIFNRQQWYFKSIMRLIPQSLTRPPYNFDVKINVYENRHFFYPKTLPEENILIAQKLYSDPLTLLDYSKFIDNLNKNTGFTEYMTEEMWKNSVIIGGIMATSLTGETKGFESSDIDILFYGIKGSEIEEKIKAIYGLIDNGTHENISLAMTENECTVARHYPHRHVQFSFINFRSIEEILATVDIEATCFAFDGKNVWTTMRGIESFNYRTNFATPLGHSIRGEVIYQRRLLKYLERGYSIAYLPNMHISAGLTKINYKTDRSNGIEMLFKARDKPEFRKKILDFNMLSTLPLGMGIGKDQFEDIVTNNFYEYYDGYNSSEWPEIAESIDDLENCPLNRTIDHMNVDILHSFYHFENRNDYLKEF